MTIKEYQVRQIPSHELYGDFWFNSEPVPISALHGKVILLDFWDYTDCSSLRAMPYVKEWNRRYSEHGLVVVGVHVPRFPFGKKPEHIQRAIARLGIEHAVVMDNESLIWSRYGNRVWPTKHLIDKEGFVRCTVDGEGNYSAVEQAIQSLLYGAGATADLPAIMDPLRESDRAGVISFKATAELLAGYLRGSVGNVEGYVAESVVEYTDPKIYFDGRFYLEGAWLNDRNSVRSQADGERDCSVVVHYQGLEVNAVMNTENGKGFDLVVLQDDKPLSLENKGEDVRIDGEGRSMVSVVEPRMYSLVKNKEFGEHVLRLTTRSGSCGLYSLSFVSSVIPVMMSNS